DGQGLLVARFGLVVHPSIAVQAGETAEGLRDVGVLGAERLLSNGESSLVEGSCLLALSDGSVDVREVVQTRRNVGMLGSERGLPDDQRLLVERLRFHVRAGCKANVREVE